MRVFMLLTAFIVACIVFAFIFFIIVVTLSSMHIQLTEGAGLLATLLLIAPLSALPAYATFKALTPRKTVVPTQPHEH